jgi:hypothetical protein
MTNESLWKAIIRLIDKGIRSRFIAKITHENTPSSKRGVSEYYLQNAEITNEYDENKDNNIKNIDT